MAASASFAEMKNPGPGLAGRSSGSMHVYDRAACSGGEGTQLADASHTSSSALQLARLPAGSSGAQLAAFLRWRCPPFIYLLGQTGEQGRGLPLHTGTGCAWAPITSCKAADVPTCHALSWRAGAIHSWPCVTKRQPQTPQRTANAGQHALYIMHTRVLSGCCMWTLSLPTLNRGNSLAES